MHTSYKTIHLTENDSIKFIYINDTIHIYINTLNIHLVRNQSDFKNTLEQLKNDYNINDNNIKLITNWFDKNYIKLNPNKEYITKFGRKIIY